MKTLLALLIASSLTANAWLVFRAAPADAAPAPRTSVPTEAPPPDTAGAAGQVPFAVLETTDPAKLRDVLRAAGAEEVVVRSVVEGALRRRYREQLAALRTARAKGAWWRSDVRTPAADDARLLKEIVLTPLREIMGRDPLDLVDAQNRLRFLPSEKRRLLAEIALDYADMETSVGGRSSIDRLKPEDDQQRLLAEERRKDVLAALTPEERAEYDLRFEGAAGLLSGRLAAMNGTEKEFRALSPLIDEMRRASASLPKGEGFAASYEELKQRTVDRIAAEIGQDRALDYLWSGPGLYPELIRWAQEMRLPATTAARVMQLAAETGARASALHVDPAIPTERKIAALQSLQETVRPQFDALVPDILRARLPGQASAWFTMLGEGRYMGFMPSLDSTGSGTTAPTSVTTPAAGKAWQSPPRPRVR